MSSESFHNPKFKVNPVWLHQKVDPVWSHNNGSLQMKTTPYQNESELSRLLSESRLSITSSKFAFFLKNEKAGKLCSSVPLRKFSSLQRLNGGMNFDDEKLVQTNLNHENYPYRSLTERLSLKGLQPFDVGGCGDCFSRSIQPCKQNLMKSRKFFLVYKIFLFTMIESHIS